MIFMDPKIDLVFKKIFDNEQHKNILISFLNAMIYESQPVIEDVKILNPYVAPKIRGITRDFLTVETIITGGNKVIIIMQFLHLEKFEKRILYKAAQTYSTQLKSGASHICKSIDQRAKNTLARTYISVDSRLRGNDSHGYFYKIEMHPLKSGENYTELNPVIALTICNFTMFPNHTNINSYFLLQEKDFLLDYPNCDLELIFVELP